MENRQEPQESVREPKMSDYVARIEQLDQDDKVWLDGFLHGSIRSAEKNQKEGA